MAVRPTQATGRPGTPVIPAAWSQAPRVVFSKTRTAWCAIRRPGGVEGTFNPTTGTRPITPNAPHFTGSARIQELTAQDQAKLVAEQQVTQTSYLIAVALAATQVAVDDIVTVTCFDNNGDPILTDHEFTVRSLSRGSLAWERDLICTDYLG